MQKSDHVSPEGLMLTFPLSISKSDFAKVKEELLEVLKRASDIVKDSPAEDVAYLNVDLFWLDP